MFDFQKYIYKNRGSDKCKKGCDAHQDLAKRKFISLKMQKREFLEAHKKNKISHQLLAHKRKK
jgi:gas vesicle protein